MQKKTENLNRPIINRKIESVIKKNLPKKKNPGPDGFTGEFYKKFKEKSTPLFLKFSQKIKSFYKSSIILIPNPEKNSIRK